MVAEGAGRRQGRAHCITAIVTEAAEQKKVVKHSGVLSASVATVAVVEDEVVVYSLSAAN